MGEIWGESKEQRQAGTSCGGRELKAKSRVWGWGWHSALESAVPAPLSRALLLPAAIPVRGGRLRGGFLGAGHPPACWSPLDPGRQLHRALLHQIRPAQQPHRLRHGPLSAGAPGGVRGASWEAGAAPGRSKRECKRERRFLKAQPPPLCTEATAQPRVLPLQNPRAASREPQQLGRWEPGEHPPPSILRPGVPGESGVWGCTSRDFQGDVQ